MPALFPWTPYSFIWLQTLHLLKQQCTMIAGAYSTLSLRSMAVNLVWTLQWESYQQHSWSGSRNDWDCCRLRVCPLLHIQEELLVYLRVRKTHKSIKKKKRVTQSTAIKGRVRHVSEMFPYPRRMGYRRYARLEDVLVFLRRKQPIWKWKVGWGEGETP